MRTQQSSAPVVQVILGKSKVLRFFFYKCINVDVMYATHRMFLKHPVIKSKILYFFS